MLTGNGPVVAIDPALLPTFKKCFASIWADELVRSEGRMVFNQDILSQCDPTRWLSFDFKGFQGSGNISWHNFLQCMFILVHKEVSCVQSYSTCVGY